MSNKARATLISEVIASIPDNVNNEISAADVRLRILDILDSYPNLNDESYLLGLKLYDPANNYAVGNTCFINGVIYAANQITTGTFNALHWDALGDSLKAFGSHGNTFQSPLNPGSFNKIDTGLTLTDTPPANCRIDIFVDGHHYECGNGTKTRPFYLSADNGTSAVSFANAASGNKLYFNGLVAGWSLELTDKISILHDKIQ